MDSIKAKSLYIVWVIEYHKSQVECEHWTKHVSPMATFNSLKYARVYRGILEQLRDDYVDDCPEMEDIMYSFFVQREGHPSFILCDPKMEEESKYSHSIDDPYIGEFDHIYPTLKECEKALQSPDVKTHGLNGCVCKKTLVFDHKGKERVTLKELFDYGDLDEEMDEQSDEESDGDRDSYSYAHHRRKQMRLCKKALEINKKYGL